MKVALFVNGWNAENVDNFIDGFNEFFSDGDTDLFVFTSYSGSVESIERNEAEDSIYSLPDMSFFDAAIIFGSGIKDINKIPQIIDRCKEANVPVIVQGIKVDGVSTVTIDNYIGMKKLCVHLIEKHGVKNAIYIAGTKDNDDSNFRLEVVKETFEEHGYSLPDENVIYANWETNLIKEYIMGNFGDRKTKLPDAFICANDQMAMFVVLFLAQLGYKIPENTIVSGFDNLSDGKVCYPSIATVDQEYKKQGLECARLVSELSHDKHKIIKSIIPCEYMPGESCGCFECNDETGFRKVVGQLWWSERYFSDNLQGRESHLDMCIMSNSKFEDIHQSMNEDFLLTTGEETEDFHIYMNPQYKKLEYMNVTETQHHNTGFGPVMDVLCARTGGKVYYEDAMNVKDIMLGYSEDGVSKTYVFRTLKVDDSVAGYMVMGYKKDAFKRREYVEFSGRLDKTLKKYQRNIDDYNKAIRVQEQANEFLRQTVEALATAVDAKDSYTNGHSYRVAKYSRRIAEESGMSEKECEDIYLAGLLHDVGKIGIDDSIINKKGKLTDEEYGVIKLHPVLGGQILSKIVLSPSLSVGARYHHERYDGNGYPEKLKGDDIPRIARIIAVADAYDAMTSMRSYRSIIPQMYVREELIKGMATQFDPEYAKIMIKLLDEDEEYTMKENRAEEVFGADLLYEFDEFKSKVTAGIRITDCPVSLKIKYKPTKNGGQPSLLLYDSADARYYLEDSLLASEMDFVEFVTVDINGSTYPDYVREVVQKSNGDEKIRLERDKIYVADIFLTKQEDHFMLRISIGEHTEEIIFAQYDSSRYLYMALTGEFCEAEILDVQISKEAVQTGYIPRIAEKITYIDGPVGDIPNVQIDGWKTDRSDIIEIEGNIRVDFHTMSLPSSRRVWHCPIVAIFTVDDGVIDGENYKELAFIRLDGEVWWDNPEITNESSISVNDDFENWSIWKQNNKSGVDCNLSISRKNNKIEVLVEDSGLEIRNITTIPADASNIYFYLTGDQCAITNIRIIDD